MKRLRVVIILVVVVALFVFLVPVVPANISLCPPNGFCPPESHNVPATVSIIYHAIGVGGRVSEDLGYQVLFWPEWICNSHSNDYYCFQIML